MHSLNLFRFAQMHFHVCTQGEVKTILITSRTADPVYGRPEW